jgi:hypothetical protein
MLRMEARFSTSELSWQHRPHRQHRSLHQQHIRNGLVASPPPAPVARPPSPVAPPLPRGCTYQRPLQLRCPPFEASTLNSCISSDVGLQLWQRGLAAPPTAPLKLPIAALQQRRLAARRRTPHRWKQAPRRWEHHALPVEAVRLATGSTAPRHWEHGASPLGARASLEAAVGSMPPRRWKHGACRWKHGISLVATLCLAGGSSGSPVAALLIGGSTVLPLWDHDASHWRPHLDRGQAMRSR